jgi:hypothetical protein
VKIKVLETTELSQSEPYKTWKPVDISRKKKDNIN